MQRPSQNWNRVDGLSELHSKCVMALKEAQSITWITDKLSMFNGALRNKDTYYSFSNVIVLLFCAHLLQVSLDSRVREVINRNLLDPSPHMYEDAQLQIYTLMHRDSFPRFLNSQIYKSLVESITGSTSET